MFHLDTSLKKKETDTKYIDLCPCAAPNWESDLLLNLGKIQDEGKEMERRQSQVRK